jgi:cytochrome c peroxidase
MLALLSGCMPSLPTQLGTQQASYPPLAAIPSSYAYRGDRLDELGRMLFFDSRLSRNRQRACSDCHDPTRNLSGPGEASWRDAPSLLNLEQRRQFGWDGAGQDLQGYIAEHASDALVLDAETAILEARLLALPEYQRLFRVSFGESRPTADATWRAIATFLTSLEQPRTPLDAYLQGDRDALSKEAQEGLELFNGEAGCISCHHGALGADGRLHNLAIPTVELWKVAAKEQIAFRYHQRRKGLSNAEASRMRADQGRWYVSRDERERGAFRTPSLRGLRHTAPYMHNGAFNSLQEVVEFYNRGGQSPDGRLSAHRDQRSQLLKPLNLDSEEKQALVALLQAWSAPSPLSVRRPSLPAERDSAPTTTPRQPQAPVKPLRERLAPRSYLRIPYTPQAAPGDEVQPAPPPPRPQPTAPNPVDRDSTPRLEGAAGSLNPPNRVLFRERLQE